MTCSRRIKTTSLAIAAVVPVALMVFPWLWLQFSSGINFSEVLSSPQSARADEVVLKSLHVAIKTGTLSLLVAALIHLLIYRSRFQKLWFILFSLPLFLSPYIFVQGWIYWLGDHGVISQQFPFLNNFSLYSDSGLVFLLTIHLFPWALILLQFGHRPLARNEKEFCEMADIGYWLKFRLLIWPRIALPLLIAFLWITLQTFWAYDIPSMLRQNLISLELMAAFGSFYELDRALAILVRTWPIAVLPLALLSLLFFQRSNLKRLLELEPIPRATPSWRDGLSAILSLAFIAIPISGLVFQISEMPPLDSIVVSALNDFKNTLLYSLSAPVLSILIVAPLFLLRKSIRLPLLSILILGLLVPSSVLGILWSQISSQSWWPHFLEEKFLMIALLAIYLLPYSALSLLVLIKTPSASWLSLRKMTPLRNRLHWQEFCNLVRPSCGWALLILSLVVIREVPLILLHYPPEGGTLALTIETMLHFDQPGLVAALSLLQFGATAIVALIFATLSYTPK